MPMQFPVSFSFGVIKKVYAGILLGFSFNNISGYRTRSITDYEYFYTAGEMGAEAAKIRELLGKTIADVEHHLVRLPTLAQGEAQRIRHMVQTETDQMLDLSARAISTIHARNAQGQRLPPQTGPAEAADGDGLKAMARRLTQRSKRGADLRGGKAGETKGWEMKTLLAAAEHGEPGPRELGSGAAAAIGALQLALADMAVDLEGIDTNVTPGKEDWKRYLMGDRTVFARKLAGVIDERAVDRITALYRDDERFHDAADAYLVEFESLLTRAREGDGGGLLDILHSHGRHGQDLSRHRLRARPAIAGGAARRRSRPFRRYRTDDRARCADRPPA